MSKGVSRITNRITETGTRGLVPPGTAACGLQAESDRRKPETALGNVRQPDLVPREAVIIGTVRSK